MVCVVVCVCGVCACVRVQCVWCAVLCVAGGCGWWLVAGGVWRGLWLVACGVWFWLWRGYLLGANDHDKTTHGDGFLGTR